MNQVAQTGLLYLGAALISRSYNPMDWGIWTIIIVIMIGCSIWSDD